MSALQLWLQNHNRKLTQDAIDEALMEYIEHVEKQRDELLAALEGTVSVAKDALDHWYKDRDMKVGNLLHALSGLVKGYDRRADAVHNAIASVKGGAA